MTAVQELAKEARYCFEFTGEDNPTMRDNIWITKDDNKPDWLQKMIRDAGHHNADILPDDWCYAMTVNALESIIDAPDDGNMDEYLWDSAYAYTDSLNHRLIEWFGSHSSRVDLVNESVADLGYPGNIMDAISQGQQEEIHIIFQSVYQFLANLAEETDDDSEGDDD